MEKKIQIVINPKTCQKLFSTKSLYVNVLEHSRIEGKRAAKGCIYKSGKFDPECSCKRLKKKTGENACRKIKIPRPILQEIKGNTDILDQIKNISSGYSNQSDGEDKIKASSKNLNASITGLKNRVERKVKSFFRKKGIDSNSLIEKGRNRLKREARKDNKILEIAKSRIRKPNSNLKMIKGVNKTPVSKKIEVDKFKIKQKKIAEKAKSKIYNSFTKKDENVSYSGEEVKLNEKHKVNYGDIIKNQEIFCFEIISSRYVKIISNRLSK